MVAESKIVVFLLGLAIFTFILVNRRFLKRVDYHKILIVAFCMVLLSWLFAITEMLIWNKFFNFLEHACYVGSALALLTWILKTAKTPKGY